MASKTSGKRKDPNSKKAEPAIAHVYAKIDTFSKALEKGFAHVEMGFAGVDLRFAGMETRMGKQFSELHERLEKAERLARLSLGGLETLKERTEDIHRRTVNLEHRVEDVRDTLDSIGQAVDKDAVAVVAHGRRIARIEARLKTA